MTQVDLWTLENELRTPDTDPLCGVDEAGRGPLAGPVCAAAVMLPPGLEIPGLNDSKKLSEKKREALYDPIIAPALSYGIAFATVEEIEEHNILGATFLAMNRAIAQLAPQPALALIDGNRDAGITVPSRCIVGGDGKCADIHNIKYSNFCDVSIHHDKRANKLVACAAIDNMVKGAAGQAIQNMNIIFGLDEKTGLVIVPPAF